MSRSKAKEKEVEVAEETVNVEEGEAGPMPISKLEVRSHIDSYFP